jgi:DNA-binding NarL/FixJ family response regulator
MSVLSHSAVIVVSQHAVRPYTERTRAPGAFAYVTKDAIHRKLLEAVADAPVGGTERAPN